MRHRSIQRRIYSDFIVRSSETPEADRERHIVEGEAIMIRLEPLVLNRKFLPEGHSNGRYEAASTVVVSEDVD